MMFGQPTQDVDFLIDNYLRTNNVKTPYEEEKPLFLDNLIDDYLKKSGYEIPGEMPKERIPSYPEGTYPGLTAPPKEAYIGPIRSEEEKRRIESATLFGAKEEKLDWLPELPLWQQIKDLTVAWATGKLKPGMLFWDEAIRGLTLGNIKDPAALIEKLSGKTGLKEQIQREQVEFVEKAVGKPAIQYRRALALGEKAAEMVGSFAPVIAAFSGAGVPAVAATKIPILQAAIRGTIAGAFLGIAEKPEDDTIMNRLKNVPKEALFWGALDAGVLTASQVAKIINYNLKYGKIKGKWGRWERVPPIRPGEPGRVEVKEFSAEEILEIKRKMDINAVTPGTHQFTDAEKKAIEFFSDVDTGGWRNWRQGFRVETEIGGVPPTYPTAAFAEVAPIPREPKFWDIFKKGPLPVFEETFQAKWPEIAPEAPKRGVYELPATPEAAPPPKAPPAAREPIIRPQITEAPEIKAPPSLTLDITPKPEGGWTYTFRPGITEEVPKEALEIISPEIKKQLPPHIQEIIEKRLPKVWKPRKARQFKDPLLDDIYKLGGISPGGAYGMEEIRELALPIGLIRKDGLPMHILADNLKHRFPEIEAPGAEPDINLYNMLFDRVKRKRHGFPAYEEPSVAYDKMLAKQYQTEIEDYYINEWKKGTIDLDSISESEKTLINELKAYGQISDADFGEQRERAVETIQEAKAIPEIAIKQEKPAMEERLISRLKKTKWEVPVTASQSKKYQAQLRRYLKEGMPIEDVAEISSKMQLETPYVYEIPELKDYWQGKIKEREVEVTKEMLKRPRPEAKPAEVIYEAEARKSIIAIKDKTTGKIYKATAGETLHAQMTPRLNRRGIKTDDMIPGFLTAKGEWTESLKEARESMIEEVKEPIDRDKIKRELARLLPELGIKREKWGEIARRVIKYYDPQKATLEAYIKNIAFGRTKKGVPILTAEGEPFPKPAKIKEVPLEKIPEPAEKVTPYDRLEMKQEEARLRDLVMAEAHDDIDLDILESRIFKDPPEALEEIAKRHGVTRQAMHKRWEKLIAKLQNNPSLIKIAKKKYELHSFPGMISEQDIRRLRDMINKYFTSSKGVSKEVDMMNDERIGGILAEKFGATVEAKRLNKFIKEHERNPGVLQYFKDLLEGGDIEASALPRQVKDDLLSMRQRIDRLSDMIMAYGAMPEKTKAVFEENKARYLGKFYRLYETIAREKGKVAKRYWDPPKEVRDRFKAALKRDFPDTFGTYSEEELDNFLEGMVRGTDFYAKGTKRTKRIPPEHYIHRIRLTPEYREFAGEIIDPRYLYLKTVADQAVMGYNAKMLKFLKDKYPDLWTKDLDIARRRGWQKSQIPDDWHAYGEMAGLYVDPELNEYIRNEFYPSRSGIEYALERYIINPFKWTKTIGSIPTHARNFLGNPMFSGLLRCAIWNPANARFYVRAAKIIIGREKEFAKEWEDLVRSGVTETQFWGAEIPKFYEELLRLEPAAWPEKFLDVTFKVAMKKLGNLYNSEDVIYRIAAHYKNMEVFGMTAKESVEELNRSMTNYRKLPTAVEILRRYPILGPFISFKANVVKIISANAEQAIKDMAKKESRQNGIRRAFILASMLSIPIIAQEVSKKVFHIDDEQQKIIEKYMTTWRRHGIYFYWRNKAGDAKVFDFTYIFPAGDIQQAIRALFAGDIESFNDAISLLAHPILDLYSILVQDRDPAWGTRIPGGFKEQIAKAITQIWLPASAPIPSLKALVHGDIRAGSLTPYQIKTLIDAWYGEAPVGREPKKFTEEIKNFLTGVRTFDLNPDQIMRSYIRSKKAEINEIMQDYKSWLRQNPNARDYEIRDKLKVLHEKQRKINEELKRASEDLKILIKGGFALESSK